MQMETARLRLRQWCGADREPFAQLNADPRVMEFFPALLDRAASDALADRCEAQIAERGWGFWAVEIRESGEFIGFVGLNAVDDLPFAPCIEIGWRLGYEYWGKGFATEAALAALRFAFEELGLAEVVSFTAVVNVRSQAVMQRLGMERSLENFEHPRVPVGNWLREHCLYRKKAI